MVSKAQKDAVARYDAKNTIQIHLKLNTTTDKDVIERLDSVESMQGYIKDLIRKDIAISFGENLGKIEQKSLKSP